jgi:hypothetical protein
MELNSLVFWNIILTLVYAPLALGIKSNMAETKRIDILLNKTREELPTVYVTKTEITTEMDRLFKRFDKLEEKIDQIAKKN